MSEKPQEARAGGQEDLLEQIISQGLEKMGAQAQTAAAEEDAESEAASPPRQESGGESTSPPDGKNRRSSVYLYLLILFGAAFLMLLLAYFVQQRSSESTISGLHDSINLSRTELLNEIRALEEKNAELEERIAAQRGELSNVYVERAQWQRLYEEAALEADDLKEIYYSTQEQLYSWEFFWELERYYLAEDYEGCAAILILRDQGEYHYSTPDTTLKRETEIVQAVINAGLLNEDFYLHPEDYEDLVNSFISRFYVSGY